jgi:gliding motility-associated-like protein
MALIFFAIPEAANSQSYEIDAYNGQTVTTCSGTFYDSGGSGGNYANNESYSMTFCSASGQYLTFDFSQSSSALNLDAGTGDTLYFYYGTSATGTPIAFLTSSDDVSFTQLMINTLSTCVTVKWKSNASAVDGGWAAVIGCQNPPLCAGNPPAADLFGQATVICNLSNYCGTTASYYGEDLPYNLNGGGTCPAPDDGIFGGTIENNSWLAFQALSTSASFNFNVTNCSGDGIQVGIFGFNGSAFNLVSPCSFTDGSQGGNFTVTASGLTVGSMYYIMIDGNAGANCDYTIQANTGVAVVNAGPDQNICTTSTMMAANTPASGTGVWSCIAGSGTFANINSPTSAVSGLSNGINRFIWTIPSGPCQNVADTVIINVTAGISAVISYAGPYCTSTSTPQAVTLSGPAGGTYTAVPAGLSLNSSTGVITPSTSTAGTYTVTYTVAGACAPATTTVTINSVVTPTFTISTSLCSGSTAPLLPAISNNGITGSWSPATVSNTATGTYSFTPSVGQCAANASVTVTVSAGTPPTFTSSSTNVTCAGPNTGSITINPITAGTTFNWVSGPVVSPVPAANKPAGATDERALINLPAGTYCVNISGPASGTTTQTLFTETFESGLSNWTIDNSNGSNIWIRNNAYTGGTCMVGATPFSCPNIPNQPAAITNYPQSFYLHINATNTNPVSCGSGSSAPFPPLNANYNGSDIAADQKATINTTFNTAGLSNITVSFYWMGDGDASDYGSLEYSLNGGSTWTIAGAKLNNQTSWVAATRTDPSWANQSNLKFRFRWINNASSSQDPPICIDQITITGDQTSTCTSTVSQCFTITAPASITPVFNTVGPVCQGSAAPVLPASSNNTPAITGSWSPAVSTATAGSTTYTFTPNAGQCATNTTMNITVNATPAVSAVASPASICSGASTSLTGSGASSYTWMPGNISGSTLNVSPASSTTYSVTGTNAAGCSASASVNVTVNPLPAVTASASPASICAGGSSSLSAAGASTYSWNPGSLSGAVISVSPAGTTIYTVSGTSSAGCTGQTSVTVTVNPNPVLAVTASPSSICPGETSIITASGASSYSWNPGGSSGASITVSPISSTTYSVTGTSANGCSSSNSVTLAVNSSLNVTATALPSAICAGQSASLTASGALSYIWNPGGLSGSTIAVSPLTTTTYTVSGTSASGCMGTAAVTVTVNNLPTVTASAGSASLCSGGSTTLTASGASSYIWTPGNISGNGISVSPATTTSYTVSGTSAAGCISTASVTVTVNPLPLIAATALPSVICAGSSSTLTASGGIAYVWNPGNISGNGIIVSPSSSTTYTVTGTDANGCAKTASISVVVNPKPVPVISASPASVCTGQSSVLSATAGTSYSWNPGGMSGNNITVSPATTTIYTVTATSAAGCSGSSSLTLTVNPLPVITASASPSSICAGQSSTLTGNGANVYTWNPGNLTGNSITVTPTNSTTYTVSGTSSASCSNTSTVSVTVNPLPVITATASSGSICSGDNDTLTATGALSYVWSPNGIPGNSIVVSPSSTYTYTVTGSSAAGCTSAAGVSITVNPIPNVNISASPPNICMGSQSTLTASGASSYTWAASASLSSSSGSTVVAQPVVNTSYTVTGTSNGCSADAGINIGVYSNLQISVSPTADTICKGGSTLLSAQGGLNYNWSPQNTLTPFVGANVNASPVTTTTYTVTGSDAGGCTGSTTATVYIYQGSDLSFSANPTAGCAPLEVDFDYSPNGLIDTNTLFWNFGDSFSGSDTASQTHTSWIYSNPGDFVTQLTGFSKFGCPVTAFDTIHILPAPVADFVTHPQVLETDNPHLQVDNLSLYETSWSWDFGDPGSGNSNFSFLEFPHHDFSDTGQFAISLIVMNELGCSDTAIRYIRLNQSFVFFMPNAFTPDNNGLNDIFIGKGLGIDEDGFEFYIYDRWGEKLFESHSQLTGWDGRDQRKNTLCEPGVYAWMVKLKDETGIVHTMLGSVTLLK